MFTLRVQYSTLKKGEKREEEHSTGITVLKLSFEEVNRRFLFSPIFYGPAVASHNIP